MLVVVYQRALAAYVSRVLPSLDVDGVPVMTFAAWAESVRKATFPLLQAPLTDDTPALVMRAKAHGAMLRILVDRQQELARFCDQALARELGGKPGGDAVLAAWAATAGPIDERMTALRTPPPGRGQQKIGSPRDDAGGACGRECPSATGRRGAALLTDRGALGAASRATRPLFSAGQLDDIHRWCVERDRLRTARSSDDDEPYALGRRGRRAVVAHLPAAAGSVSRRQGRRPAGLRAPDGRRGAGLAPVELAVLLETTTSQRSVTMAGDTAQAIAPEHGFSNWSALLDDLGIPHERVEPLRVSYRSTRRDRRCAGACWDRWAGTCGRWRRARARRSRPSWFLVGGRGQRVPVARAERADPGRADRVGGAGVASPGAGASLLHDGGRAPRCQSARLVADQDFSFTAGIDVTDVRQTKGLSSTS